MINLKNIIKKYSKELTKELKANVGVKTGALKRSISDKSNSDGFSISMLDYGEYIQPWKASTNEYNEPGYIHIVDELEKEMEEEMATQLEKDIVVSIPNQINIKF